jgi:hypothetical protein
MSDLSSFQNEVRKKLFTLKFKCEKVKGRDLKPGDLFSTVGDLYWNLGRDPETIGEKVYIRTEAPPEADDLDSEVYRITIL